MMMLMIVMMMMMAIAKLFFQSHLMVICQVARLLQIPSVEKICKKFVTYKINLDNCIGKHVIGDILVYSDETSSQASKLR